MRSKVTFCFVSCPPTKPWIIYNQTPNNNPSKLITLSTVNGCRPSHLSLFRMNFFTHRIDYIITLARRQPCKTSKTEIDSVGNKKNKQRYPSQKHTYIHTYTHARASFLGYIHLSSYSSMPFCQLNWLVASCKSRLGFT